MKIAELLYGSDKIAAVQEYVRSLRQAQIDASAKMDELRQARYAIDAQLENAKADLNAARDALQTARAEAEAMHIDLD